MEQNYRPFSWEEYLKNPELLRTRDGREVEQLTRFDAPVDFNIRGVLDGIIRSWNEGGRWSGVALETNNDLVLLNPPTETKKYHVIIKDPITGNVIDEKFVNSFCIFD